MKNILLGVSSFLLLSSFKVISDGEYNHFPSLAAPTTDVALSNLAKFNKELGAIVNKSALTPEDMVKVHELTYTLENAVMRLQSDLETIAADLEKVHKASERLDGETVKRAGHKYLTATDKLLTPAIK